MASVQWVTQGKADRTRPGDLQRRQKGHHDSKAIAGRVDPDRMTHGMHANTSRGKAPGPIPSSVGEGPATADRHKGSVPWWKGPFPRSVGERPITV